MEETAAEETKEPKYKKVPLTPEEEAYFKDYLFGASGAFHRYKAGFCRTCRGKSGSITGSYNPLYERNCKDGSGYECRGDFSCGFDPREPNLSLIQALGEAGTELRDEKWLMGEVRKGLIRVLEEQTQRKFADDSLVGRVEKLESAVRELNDDEDDKNAFSIDELAIILDMKVDEIRDVLRLTGDDQ